MRSLFGDDPNGALAMRRQGLVTLCLLAFPLKKFILKLGFVKDIEDNHINRLEKTAKGVQKCKVQRNPPVFVKVI